MKIIHCADLHLDSRMTSNLSSEQARERKNEILKTYSLMVDYAVNNDVKVIIIAGDLFDTKNVSATARNVVKNSIMDHPHIDFLYLKGNHDNDNFLSTLDAVPDNLKLFGDSWKTYKYKNITISGIELSKGNSVTAYNSLVLDHDDFNIVTLHGQEAKYQDKDKAETINLLNLKNKNIDYLALGHIHGYKVGILDNRGKYCYSGCLEGRGFDECGKKGFILIDIDEDKRSAEHEFISIAQREIFTEQVDVTGCLTTQDALECIKNKMKEMNYPKASLMKFVLFGDVDVECEINVDYMARYLEDKFYFIKIYNETKWNVNYSDYALDESLKGEFVRMVQASDMEDEKKAKVIRYGIQSLSGEEIKA